MKRVVCLLYLVFYCTLGVGSVHAKGPFVTSDSGQKSFDLHLAEDPQWLALLHYDSARLGLSKRSRVESKEFFFSENGAYDPKAELSATISAFISDTNRDDAHAACKFPARYEWLSRVLALQQYMRATPECTQLKEWYRGLEPDAVTVVFPAAFLNNPASAFGHTFLRLDRPAQTEETRLLAYSADFSAFTHGEDALTYAFKGLTGGYYGYYSVTPYYKKVTTYSDLENRDIWEYQLNLRADEVRLLALHLWELRAVPFTYYYFDENCSYHVLGLLQVARPSLELLKNFNFWILPVDTIRELLLRQGILRTAIFRPSAATKLRHRIAETPEVAQDLALDLVDQNRSIASLDLANISSLLKAQAFDLAYEFQTYQRIREGRDDEPARVRAWELLAGRSTFPPFTIPELAEPKIRPEAGHKSAMLGLGVGLADGELVEEVNIRPTLHTLSDELPGYLPGAQIRFLEATIRESAKKGLQIQNVKALQIISLTPQERFFKPYSWQVNLEGKRLRLENSEEPMVYSLEAGFGKSYTLSKPVMFYALFNSDLELSPEYEESYALGFGPRLGLIANPIGRTGTELFTSVHTYTFGERHTRIIAGLTERVSLGRNHALRFDLDHQNDFGKSTWNGFLRFEVFFTP